mgnify:CR=1 FL=1
MLLDSNSISAPCFSALSSSHPVLSCEASAAWEASVLETSEDEWQVMQRVGKKIASEIILELAFGFRRRELRVLALVGKGHNGGDALLALAELVERGHVSTVCILLSAEVSALKENTRRAYDRLLGLMPKGRVVVIEREAESDLKWLEEVDSALATELFDLSIDGFLGLSYRAPLKFYFEEVAKSINANPNIGLRVAVDMPTGVGSVHAFVADVTVAAGICKDSVSVRSNEAVCGKLRYVDVGLLGDRPVSNRHVLLDGILNPVRSRRSVSADKRSMGHVAIVAGSCRMPGAMAMCVRGALQSGVGLVTVFAPESIVHAFSTAIPEAMWVGWPETPDGELAMEGEFLLSQYAEKATALILGPGIGNGRETGAMVRNIVTNWRKPIVLDADALTQDAMFALGKRREVNAVLTPHLGEFFRMTGSRRSENVEDEELCGFSGAYSCVTVLKGPNTRIANHENVFLNTTGNSVLARGGSGDILSGMIGGLLARWPKSSLEAACLGTYWHGRAGDVLAYENGQNAVRITQLLDCLVPALEAPLKWEA